MSLLRTVGVLVAVGVLAGCSQSPYPRATYFEDNTQGVMVAVSHWQVLSKRTADKVFGCLEGLTYWDEDAGVHQPYCRQDVEAVRYAPIYVDRTDGAMPFAEAFYRDLQTEIVERGVPLALRGEPGVLDLGVRVQLVDRPMPVPINSMPGMYTALGAGVYAIASGVLPAIIGAGFTADAWANATSQGGAQVIVTTTLSDGNRVLMSATDGYFIDDADLAHFASSAPAADLGRPMKAGATPPELRTFTVVEE